MAAILFREVSFLIGGDSLIRSLPLAVLTHPLCAWAGENVPGKPGHIDLSLRLRVISDSLRNRKDEI